MGATGCKVWDMRLYAGVRSERAGCGLRACGGRGGSRALASLAGPGRALLLFALEETTASGIHRLPA